MVHADTTLLPLPAKEGVFLICSHFFLPKDALILTSRLRVPILALLAALSFAASG